MGVKNLWRLLLPIGKRISIETLSHQTLAIDASIWLTQISKACRDPETGRLLPNRPHVRIFLLRLMRLLFHRIKPVVVFDGIMPEVKRRELQRRRDRREKLWRGAGEDGEDADLALKRTAKKILVKQLKEWREKKLEAAAADGGGGGNAGKKRSPSKRSSSKNVSETGGAFAAGFTTGEEEADAKVPSTQSDNTGIDDNHAGSSEKQDKSNDADDIISIKSSSSDKEEQTKPGDVNNIDSAYESENDWEMSVAIQSSINDCIEQQRQQQIQYQDLSQQPVEAIASLPTEARSQWMESQYKAQRIQSRRECIDAAANPEDYSSTQLRNFLKGSKLNKKMGEIGKLAGQLEVQKDDDNGFVTVEENDGGGGRRRVLKRPQNKDDYDSDDDILNNELPTTKVLFGEDSDESEDDNEEEGGGFLLPGRDVQTEQVKQVATLASDEIVIDDASDEDDGSIRETSAAAAAADAGSNTFNTSNEGKCDGMIAALPSEAARSQLMALTSADQEWATWGDNDIRHSASEEQVTKSITTKPSNADILSAESDSDDEPTFLPSQHHQKVQSSFIDTATKPDALSDKPVSPTQCAVQDEEDDDVDWEDGSDVDQGEGDGHKESNESLDRSSSELSCQKDGNDNEDPDDEDIDWEDGGECNQVNDEEEDSMVKLKGNHILPSKQAHDNDDDEILSDKKQRKDPNLLEHGGDRFNKETIEIEEVTDDAQYHVDNANEAKEIIFDAEEAEPINYEPDPSNNAFDVEEFDSDDPTTAALRHAQETASRLTDWAGRAVQRAIAAHIEEKGGPSPSKIKAKDKSPMVDLTVGEDEEEFEDDHESDLEVIDVNNSTTVENKNTKDSNTKTADLFDTSLEGLNKVHHDIMEEEKLMERDMSTITDEMKMDILNLLQLCGIPWVESPSEAEAQCAELEKLGLVDGVVTEDSDVFVFGGRKVYKNFFNEQKYVEAYFAKDMLKDLGLGRSQLVALAMLLGGDYTDGVKGVGIVNGMEILQSFAVEDGKEGIRIGLQRFREWLDGLDDPVIDEEESSTFVSKVKLFHKKHQSARTRWIAPADFPSPAIIDGYMKPAVDSSETNFTWGKPDIDGLRQFCANSIGWDNEETDRVVKPVLNILESGSTQTRIESYFMKYEDNIKFAEVKSKRLKAVLDDIQTTGDDEEGSNKRRKLS